MFNSLPPISPKLIFQRKKTKIPPSLARALYLLSKKAFLSLMALSLFSNYAEARNASHQNIYHRVQKGENLGRIARKYKTSVRQIQRWNRLASSNHLQTGKLLKVGHRRLRTKKFRKSRFSKTRFPRYHRVRPGESLSVIAKKYRTSVAQLRRLNRISKKHVLQKGRRLIVGYNWKRRKAIPKGTRWLHLTSATKVKLPLNYTPSKPKLRNFQNRYYNLRIFASSFSQGKAAYLELIPRKQSIYKTKTRIFHGKSRLTKPYKKNIKLSIESFQIHFGKQTIPLSKESWGYKAIFAIPPELRPGTHLLRVQFQAGPKKYAFEHHIYIADTKYPVSIWRRNVGPPKPKGKQKPPNPKVLALIQASTKKKRKVFALRSTDKLQPRLSHPRDLHKITSKFHTTRKYIRYYYKRRRRVYLKSYSRKHRGTDLKGRTGAPIYAMADGRVVAARRMFYEGNFTIIDHGNGIFTGYMHQSKFLVYEGEKIIAGQLIGRVGSTGQSTGPHLHMSLWIRGMVVDPLSLLSLPIR